MDNPHAAKAENMFKLLLESMGLFFQLRSAGKRSGHVTSGGSGIWGFLHSLAVDGPQTVPHLARARPVTRQHIQQLTNDAVADGLVELIENPAHKRSKLVKLTPKGGLLEQEMTDRLKTFAGELAHDLDAGELAAAVKVLNAVRAKLSGTDAAPGRLN